MADGVAGEAAPPGELQDSAPLRDFARPGLQAPELATLAVPVRLPAGTPLAFVAACVVTLLARHSGRSSVAFAIRSSALQLVRADASPDRRFGELVQDLQTALARPEPSAPEPVGRLPGVLLDTDGNAPVAADLTLRLVAEGGTAGLFIDYDTLLYRAESVSPLARQLAHLLSTLAPDANVALGQVDLHDTAEQRRLIHGLNGLRSDFPLAQTLSHLIGAQAAETPDAIAAVHGERVLTYEALNAAANRLARQLVALGVGPGQFVAIVDRRGLDFVVAMHAIWKAGAAYVPVDPGYPEDRVRYMLADSQAAVAIVGADVLGLVARLAGDPSAFRHIVCQQALYLPAPDLGTCRLHGPAAMAAMSPRDLPPQSRAADPAYMIYTSGSTGRPKGAIVRHDGAVNHIHAQAQALGRDGISRFLQSAPSSSDISVWQFAAPLVFGGTTVIVDDATDIENLVDQVRRHRVQIIELVPVVLKFLIDFAASLPPAERALPSLRWAMVTGESAPVGLVNAWLALYPRIPLVNAYGPTEAADDVAQAILREPLPPRQLTVPIGRPLANLDVYVLDERLQPAPVGVTGEICVAGVGVGNGYWRQPEKTRESFVPNPFPDAAGPVIYRTGDLGRLRDDGTLECLGRRDHQVQLRGVRIELQEIEAVLRGHPGVREAVAQVFHDGAGDGQLVAYAVAAAVGSAEPQALRRWLAERLPPALVPSSVVLLDRLPLNPAGKVDRQALQPPDAAGAEHRVPDAGPRTAAEATVAAIWQEELGLRHVGIDDDFFDLGGDSLAALAIVVAARAEGLHLRPADVLRHPTVARLAAIAEPLPAAPARAGLGGLAAMQPLGEAERQAFLAREPGCESVHPLTPPQQGIFMHWLLARDKTAYVDQYSFALFGPLQVDALQQAWATVAARHPALRTVFLRSALSQPVQAVQLDTTIHFEFVDLSRLDASPREAALHDLMDANVAKGFALSQPPLSRMTLVRCAPEEHRLVWTHHHLVVDGWSMSRVLGEVLRLHAAGSAGVAPELPAAEPYTRYIDWAARCDLTGSEPFWRQALAGHTGAPGLDLAPPSAPKAGFGQSEVALPEDLATALTGRARAAGVTPATLLQAAWACVLARHSGGTEAVFGVVSSGRELDLPGIDAMVGLFVTTWPLRVRTAAAADSLDAWLKALQRQTAAAREHEAVPLAQITRWSDVAPGRALFETLFVMSNYPSVAAVGPLRIEPAAFRTVPAYPLSIIVVPGSAITLRLVYDRRRFDRAPAEALLREYAAAVGALAQGHDPRVAP
jgi:amino acid adenylation domain-containing protein